MKIEQFTVYELSARAKAVIKDGSRSVTITKRLNPMQEAQIRLNGDELAQLFHVTGLRTLTQDALKAFEKGDDNADDK